MKTNKEAWWFRIGILLIAAAIYRMFGLTGLLLFTGFTALFMGQAEADRQLSDQDDPDRPTMFLE